MLWNILNVQLLLEVSPLILYVCVLWSKGLLVPFLPYFASKYEKCLQLWNAAFHACVNAFLPPPLLSFVFLVHTPTNSQLTYTRIHSNWYDHTHSFKHSHTHNLSFSFSFSVLCVYYFSRENIFRKSLSLSFCTDLHFFLFFSPSIFDTFLPFIAYHH